MSVCDQPGCSSPATLRAYSSYNADHGENPHPLHARYPGPIARACPTHLGVLLHANDTGAGRTHQWVVVAPVAAPAPPTGRAYEGFVRCFHDDMGEHGMWVWHHPNYHDKGRPVASPSPGDET